MTLLTSSSTAGAMSRATARAMSGMAGSQAASHPLTTRAADPAGGRACAARTSRTEVEALTLARQDLTVPGLRDLLRVHLGPVLHLLHVLVLVVGQPLGLRIVRQLQVADDAADGAGAELGE